MKSTFSIIFYLKRQVVKKDPGLLNKLIEFGSLSVGGEKTADGSYF